MRIAQVEKKFFNSHFVYRSFVIGLLQSLSELNGSIRHFDLHSKNIMVDVDGSAKIIDYEAMDICSSEPFDVKEECSFLDPDCVVYVNVVYSPQKLTVF